MADNVVQWTPEKLQELRGDYCAQETEENAGGDEHGDHDECVDEDIENTVLLVTYTCMY